MSQTLKAEPLAAVARSVLADAAFLFCDDVPADLGPGEGQLAEATITFDAPTPGRITLRLPWHVALEAAANLLGRDRGDPEVEESALDAASELLNMISGLALKAWPAVTLSRGEVVWQDGVYLGVAGRGRFLKAQRPAPATTRGRGHRSPLWKVD